MPKSFTPTSAKATGSRTTSAAVAYNALPANLSPDIKGMRYYVLPNQPKSTNENLGFLHNGEGRNSICPSPHSGYACCRSNFHHGWPKFMHNMWMATADGGLAVAAYGPNRVTTKLGEAEVPVTIEQTTVYPFRDRIKLAVTTGKPTAFPLALRIPGWCGKPSVSVNGKAVEGVEPGTFHRLKRTWKTGDEVTLHFPMEPATSHGMNNSVAVTRGPLAFSLLIEEEPWQRKESFLDGQFHTCEIRPKGAWNYALVLKDPNKPQIEVTVADVVPAQPFKAADAPVRMTLKAFKTDEGGWGTYRDDFPARATEPPKSPVVPQGKTESITLIPYGSAQCRIAHFPWGTRD